MDLIELGKRAKASASRLAILPTVKKNEALRAVAEALVANTAPILAANEKDLAAAKENGMSEALMDRLALTQARVKGMADGILQVADLKDPVGEVLSMTNRPNGLMIGKKRVPLGVIGMIYESRPNVTADAFCLCFKTGNAVILRGGSDAIHSNLAITK